MARTAADATKAERLLGWQARHTLRDGLQRMAEWMAQVGDDYGVRDLAAAG